MDASRAVGITNHSHKLSTPSHSICFAFFSLYQSKNLIMSIAATMFSRLLAAASFAVCVIATSTDAAEYDYVIVGSGPGGGSLA